MTGTHKRYLLLVTALVAAPALATNGYFQPGYGTISLGMAGAATALSQDSMAGAANPAGMAFVGERLDAGVELFSPRRQYTVKGSPSQPGFALRPGTEESGREWFVIPNFGVNKVIDEQQTLGLSVFANGGMNTHYSGRNGGTFGGGQTGVDLQQLFIAPTWTWKFAGGHAFGFSPVIAYQRFSAEGLQVFGQMGFSSAPDALSNEGTDDAWGYGFQLGWQGQITETLRGGLSWRSILEMQKFDDYAGLFAEQGDFDIPTTYAAGLAWSGIDNHWLLLDIQHISYCDIASVGNPMLPNLVQSRLGDDNGAGFGWDDVTVFKLGWQWQASDRQAWRAGISYAEQPIPDSEVLFNILAPGVQEWHLTAGFTRELGEAVELSGMMLYSPRNEVDGANPLAPGQNIELSMQQFAASVSIGWTF